MPGSQSGSDESNDSRKRPLDDKCDLSSNSKRPNCDAPLIHLKVLIPSIAAGAVIGKDGEAIERIQKESGAKVKMSKRNDFYPGTLERVCLIVGTLEAVTVTHCFVMDRIAEKPDISSPSVEGRMIQERHKQVKLLIPNSTAGMVIGKNGTYIQDIKEHTGAYVQLSQKSREFSLTERCVIVAGELPQMKAAMDMIMTVIASDPQSSSCPNVSYSDFRGPISSIYPTGSPYAYPLSSQLIHGINLQAAFGRPSADLPMTSMDTLMARLFGSSAIDTASTLAAEIPVQSPVDTSTSKAVATAVNAFIQMATSNTPTSSSSLLSSVSQSNSSTSGFAPSGLNHLLQSSQLPLMLAQIASFYPSPGLLTGQNVFESMLPQSQQLLNAQTLPFCQFPLTFMHIPAQFPGPSSPQPQDSAFPITSPLTHFSGFTLPPLTNRLCCHFDEGATLPSESFPIFLPPFNGQFVNQQRSLSDPVSAAAWLPDSIVTACNGTETKYCSPGNSSYECRDSSMLGPYPTSANIPPALSTAAGGNFLYTRELLIPEFLIGRILGPQGRNLLDLQLKTKTIIQVSQRGVYVPGTQSRIVRVSGDPIRVDYAIKIIESTISAESLQRQANIGQRVVEDNTNGSSSMHQITGMLNNQQSTEDSVAAHGPSTDVNNLPCNHLLSGSSVSFLN